MSEVRSSTRRNDGVVTPVLGDTWVATALPPLVCSARHCILFSTCSSCLRACGTLRHPEHEDCISEIGLASIPLLHVRRTPAVSQGADTLHTLRSLHGT